MDHFVTQNISPEANTAVVFCFGLVVGSFLNVVILRLPQQLKAQWRNDSEVFLGIAQEDKNEVQPIQYITLASFTLHKLWPADQTLAKYSCHQLSLTKRALQQLLPRYISPVSLRGVINRFYACSNRSPTLAMR
jgi:prepilin signal peptidase PulO-like enzyme (type II secretory pathway)